MRYYNAKHTQAEQIMQIQTGSDQIHPIEVASCLPVCRSACLSASQAKEMQNDDVDRHYEVAVTLE